jgi:lipoprotein-anchoring transpeptidase ErfK/SrfK
MTSKNVGASLLLAMMVLAGCQMDEMMVAEAPPSDEAAGTERAEASKPDVDPGETAADPVYYSARADGNRTIPAVDTTAFHPALLRNEVTYVTDEVPGTIVIDTKGPFLYLVQPEGKALRYGIAIGREGFGWEGTGTIARTAQWPTWTPPPEMIAREPHLEEWKAGMPGGVNNPLGARALYIYFGGRDSGYRIHGTNQPNSIGWAASSGCFRMINQDVIDLYDRVGRGAKVVVL